MHSRTEKENILLGRWTRRNLDEALRSASAIKQTGKRIEFLSRQFLWTPYEESTLIGGPDTPEIFTLNLEGVDCFTFLDYVEALRLSKSFSEFKKTLKRVRYRSGKVAYAYRRHFFTDWTDKGPWIKDVTAEAGGKNFRTVHKRLNDRGDGLCFLTGISPTERDVTYIPSKAIDGNVIRRLKTGDYIGIYSGTRGLDVSHVGIVVKGMGTTHFRHASSLQSLRRVVDQDFRTYVAGKPGIVVLRPVGPVT
jgi:N-acetylmuramoyl-L-alanine amidase-like protein